MRVLILSYPVITPFAEAFGIDKKTNSAGWIAGVHAALLKIGNEVALVTPYGKDRTMIARGNEKYYSFPWKYKDIVKENKGNKQVFAEILSDFRPHVVLIFGTEYMQTMSMLEAAEEYGVLSNTAIVMQGIISEISKFYPANVPDRVKYHRFLREYVNHMDIASQQRIFAERGENEVRMLMKAQNVVGLNDWDKERIKTINTKINYYQCPNMLRDIFYTHDKWDVKQCTRHSILAVPSSFYPVKGIHLLLEGLYYVRMKYPDVKLRITLHKPKIAKTWRQIGMALSYENYVAELIDELQLWESITFLGPLGEKELVEEYLKANVFVCSSSIESDSLVTNEARILGVPSVVSYVGALPERIKQNEDGFTYQYDAPYMMASYIKKLFEDEELSRRISKASVKRVSAILKQEVLIEKWESIVNSLSNS